MNLFQSCRLKVYQVTINDIVRETITFLNERKVPLTPDNYLQTFCKVAHARGFSVEECHKKYYLLSIEVFLFS